MLHFAKISANPVASRAKTSFPPRKSFSAALCSSFHVKTPSSPRKKKLPQIRLISSAAARLAVASRISLLFMGSSKQQWPPESREFRFEISIIQLQCGLNEKKKRAQLDAKSRQNAERRKRWEENDGTAVLTLHFSVFSPLNFALFSRAPLFNVRKTHSSQLCGCCSPPRCK